jgi:uncharacterized membrane protein YqaE (UPF0057 family)
MSEGTANCFDILIAIILPPLGVFLKFGCKVRCACHSSWPLM